jgi:diguanylate cyclase (GGDEF)-like protein
VVDLDTVPDSLMATAVRTKQTLCIGDLGGYTGASGETPPRPHQENYSTNSCVVAPLIAAGEVEGVLNLTDRFDQRPFDVNSHVGASQLKVIKQACELVAVSLRNARLFEQVQRAARTCSLTGLRNHQAYTEILDIEVRRATRYKNKLSIIAFRIHGVGLLNANWGHQAGDQLLKTVADHLRGNIRDVDIAGRTGGTEFGVILPEQTLEGALVVVNRLADLYADLRVKIGDDECQVDATFGVVEFAAEGTGPELLRAALERQKQARERGERLRSE